MPRKKFKSVELFAGAGGLAIGAEQAGFRPLALVEFDKDAAATLRRNRPGWNVLHEDVNLVAERDLCKEFGVAYKELDLLTGGAPCQAFSYAGKRLGFEDTRGTLFHAYAAFLKKLQPKMFLFENVRGLVTHDGGRTYDTIMSVLSDMGYIVEAKVVNAVNYGVAQKRERLIAIGTRRDLPHLRFNWAVIPEKLVLRDVLKDVPESIGAQYSAEKRALFKHVPPGGCWRDVPEKLAKAYMKSCWGMGGGRTGILRRMSMDEPALTVLTSPAQKQTDRCHPEEDRPFTVRESARIQGFPDEWEFCGGMGSQYKQIGNAVPVGLAFAMTSAARDALKGLK